MYFLSTLFFLYEGVSLGIWKCWSMKFGSAKIVSWNSEQIIEQANDEVAG